jgi:hypothetical protein
MEHRAVERHLFNVGVQNIALALFAHNRGRGLFAIRRAHGVAVHCEQRSLGGRLLRWQRKSRSGKKKQKKQAIAKAHGNRCEHEQ